MLYEENPENIDTSRPEWLVQFFTQHGFTAQVIGGSQRPSIILNGKIVISSLVSNLDLEFILEIFSGNNDNKVDY